MKKIILTMILFILSVNSFADEYDAYASAQEQKKGTTTQSSFLVGIGFNILSGSHYEWRADVRLDQNLDLYLISNFNRHEEGDADASYDFSLGLGASFTILSNPLPLYAGGTISYVHPGTDQNGAAINAFGGLKAMFLDAFEVAGELGIYFKQISVKNAGNKQTNSDIGIRPAIYLSWFFG